MSDPAPTRRAGLLAAAAATPGFLPDDEAHALYRAGRQAADSGLGPLLEIGAYLGRSTLFLAAAVAGSGAVVYSVDHHRGSEEMQAGWPDHDPALVDGRGRMDSLPRWRAAIAEARAEDLVVGVIGRSERIASDWRTPLSLVFVDGGHAAASCRADYLGFSPWLLPGGLLVFHDVYPQGRGGGEAPWRCYLEARATGAYLARDDASFGSLFVLERRPNGEGAAASERRASTTAAAE